MGSDTNHTLAFLFNVGSLLAGSSLASALWWASSEGLLHCDLLTDTLEWVTPLEFDKLLWSVLVKELIDGHESSTNLDLDLVLLNLDVDLLRSELIHSL